MQCYLSTQKNVCQEELIVFVPCVHSTWSSVIFLSESIIFLHPQTLILYPYSRKTRGVDFGLLTHPDLLFHEEGLRKEDLDLTCQLRYQQSEVDVYARFVLSDGDRKQYYIHRKALFKITDIVLPRLRVADVSVANLRDNIVEGLKPGRTEIQASNF